MFVFVRTKTRENNRVPGSLYIHLLFEKFRSNKNTHIKYNSKCKWKMLQLQTTDTWHSRTVTLIMKLSCRLQALLNVFIIVIIIYWNCNEDGVQPAGWFSTTHGSYKIAKPVNQRKEKQRIKDHNFITMNCFDSLSKSRQYLEFLPGWPRSQSGMCTKKTRFGGKNALPHQHRWLCYFKLVRRIKS